MPRLEIRLSDFEAARLDELRGPVPKGTWLKRVAGIEQGGGAQSGRHPEKGAPVREPSRSPAESQVEKLERAKDVPGVRPASEWLTGF